MNAADRLGGITQVWNKNRICECDSYRMAICWNNGCLQSAQTGKITPLFS
jgi:hypothetical protein